MVLSVDVIKKKYFRQLSALKLEFLIFLNLECGRTNLKSKQRVEKLKTCSYVGAVAP